MNLAAIALQGLEQAQVQLEAAATQLASAGAASSQQGELDTVDLSAQMVALMSAKNFYFVNLATLKTADQVQKTLIDLTA
ncbi:MAG: hypothetical protein LAO24_15865 [Acidobacteriia bacterium]|nr:hypothetical protein [Terriglobia bacterium]